eukprot:CAMPEP_0170603654 /NCGR_PEP_ID=MMETSP0224-20130122/19023_1 /TAXON_ID=285029 /ORGANISM="Togula jolla, Strain CCCM 725" /LENGTH=165 /DNA_ID=CAMNT_0010928541 /DNA_START=57 /DNA_END=554 /DNA_ORIENTATION=+
MAEEVEAGGAEEEVFYASKTGLDALEEKLKKEVALTENDLKCFAYPGDGDDESILVPIDLSVIDASFDEDEELVDMDMRLELPTMIEKLGVKGAAQALIDARKKYEANVGKEDPEERLKSMTVKEWKDVMADDGEEDEDGEEEDDDEDDEEEETKEPTPKKAKTT